MGWLKPLLMSFVMLMWITPVFAVEEDSYYFQGDVKQLERLDEVDLSNWLTSRNNRQAKFDLRNLDLKHVLDPRLHTLDLLSYENVFLTHSNVKLEKMLSGWIVNGDPSIDSSLQDALKARAALVLFKLKPQELATLRPLLKVLTSDVHFRMRQTIAGIFVKASPRLDTQMVDVLKVVMKNDADSPTRSLATLAVLLNSENNEQNLKDVVQVLMEDHRDIARFLQPWSVVRAFLDQSQNHLLETPSREVTPAFKTKILDLVRDYKMEGQRETNGTRYAKHKLLLLQDM